MKQYFVFRESSNRGWHLVLNWDLWTFNHAPREGSYGILAARFSGLSWPDWLRYCRQNGARLYGKNNLYPVAIWEKPNEKFLNELNTRVEEISNHIDLKELQL